MFNEKINDELSLRLLETRDAAVVFNLVDQSRDYLRRWLGWVDDTKTVQDTEKFIQITMEGFSARRSLNAAILYKGQIVGIAGYNEFDWTNKIAYIGYWMGEGYQGKGIMTNAVRFLTRYAIDELELNRVDIRAAVQNKKSRAIAERLGFTEEGRLRQAEYLYDRYVDHVIYGMLATDWKERSL
ncbi:ribosomal-protein-serine acetyltransferase [Paraliobacillus quinghaiensis]|uniref:Ribosomal-protein-serine acetyltransferase n=1 Tax=Paraliobacillus quinghaiensis TaxID=470815 RepID=A0A917TRI3_9BACI|nr:GNAT family protein [Paraliobacillus quinghaiensis]GGM33757.1 ribosomal-protein-serine acetyltransferase [Paraliobacillus quinghaiensis]